MSTKMTIEHNIPGYPKSDPDGSDYHLYLECFEKGAIYLELRGDIKFEASNDRVVVRIPRDVFEKIASGKHKNILKNHDSDADDW